MPLYHFNLDDHVRCEDAEGTELADDDTARVQAVIFAGDYLSDHPELIIDGQRFIVEVTDDDHRKIMTVTIEATACQPN